MSKIPTRLLPAIVVPIAMLVIATIGFLFYRRRKNRCTRKENSDEQFSSDEYSKPYTFEDYESPYENDVYEEYMIITDRPSDQRKPHHILEQANNQIHQLTVQNFRFHHVMIIRARLFKKPRQISILNVQQKNRNR